MFVESETTKTRGEAGRLRSRRDNPREQRGSEYVLFILHPSAFILSFVPLTSPRNIAHRRFSMRRWMRSSLFDGLLSTLTICLLVEGAISAQAASPSLGVILPRGLQRGNESVLTFHGGQLADAKEIMFFSPGFTVTKLEPSAGSVKATIKVAPDCRLGEHVCHVRTASGVTEYRTFYVGPFPEISEKEPNSDFTTPQPIPMNVTVNGVIQAEDVDYFVVDAKKGQRISVEIEGMRLGVTMFDPYIAILDSKRFELITADDTPLLKQDAVASIIAPADGKYVHSGSRDVPTAATAIVITACTSATSRGRSPSIRPAASWGTRSTSASSAIRPATS